MSEGDEMTQENKLALDESRKLIKTYSKFKHLVDEIDKIEKILYKIDTPKSIKLNKIVLLEESELMLGK